MPNRVTIKDIARELGISTSTVSRALADSWDVKRETRDKVLAVAQRLNYRPNLNAKNLQNKHTGIIGIIIPEFVNSFFPNVVLGIQEVLYRENYQMIITQSNETREQELENLRILQDYMVDGIIMSVTNEGGNEEAYRKVMESGTPMAFFNRCPAGVKAVKVLIDDTDMAREAVNHLIATGRRRIWHLEGPANMTITDSRRKGYEEAMTEAGLDGNIKSIPAGIFIEDGSKAVESLLSDPTNRPDAIFAFNDPTAIGAMKAIKKVGLRIPGDIAIVGFSEGRMATVVEPQLTSVLQPMKEMGREVAALLLKMIRSERPIEPRTVTLNATLNIRASSLRP